MDTTNETPPSDLAGLLAQEQRQEGERPLEEVAGETSESGESFWMKYRWWMIGGGAIVVIAIVIWYKAKTAPGVAPATSTTSSAPTPEGGGINTGTLAGVAAAPNPNPATAQGEIAAIGAHQALQQSVSTQKQSVVSSATTASSEPSQPVSAQQGNPLTTEGPSAQVIGIAASGAPIYQGGLAPWQIKLLESSKFVSQLYPGQGG